MPIKNNYWIILVRYQKVERFKIADCYLKPRRVSSGFFAITGSMQNLGEKVFEVDEDCLFGQEGIAATRRDIQL